MDGHVMDLIPNRGRLEVALPMESPRTAWLAARRQGIGGSDVAAILGLSKWRTAQDVFLEKVGTATGDSENWQMKQGHAMEPVIAEEWARSVGADLYRLPMLRDREAPHHLGNFDRIAVVGGTAEVLEVKWSTRGIPDDVPEDWFLQVMWYLHLSGLERADVTVGAPHDEPKPFPILYDADLAAKMVAAVDLFWFENVLANVLPAPQSPEERIRAAVKRGSGSGIVVEATPEADAIARDILAIRASMKEEEARDDALCAALSECLGVYGAEKMRGLGWTAMFTKPRKGNVDWDALCADLGIPEATREKFRKPSGAGSFRFEADRGRK